MRSSRRRAKSTYPIVSLQISLTTTFQKNIKKSQLWFVGGSWKTNRPFWPPKCDRPGGGAIRPYPRPPCFFNKNVCEKETSKNTLQGGTAVSGCQNGTVPEQGEVHLAYSLFANFIENDFKTKLRKIRLSEVPQFLAAKMARSRSRAKSTYPLVSLQISLKTIFQKNIEKS